MSDPNQTPSTQDKRDGKGRFAPGHPGPKCGSPGSRRQKVKSRLYKFLLDELTANDSQKLRSVVEGWIADAIENSTPRKHLIDRLLGVAAESESASRVDKLERLVLELKKAVEHE